MFTSCSSITIDNNSTTSDNIDIVNIEKQHEDYQNNSSYENSHSYFDEIDNDDDDDDDDDDVSNFSAEEYSEEYSSDDDEEDDDDNMCDPDYYYDTLCSEENVNKIKHNIGICFKWYNKKNNPTKPIVEQKFKQTYKLLENYNIIDKINVIDTCFQYLLHFKLIEYVVIDNLKKIRLNFSISYNASKLNELIMCYRYQNEEDKPVLFSTFISNISLLKDKNIIDFKFSDKEKLKQQFLQNKISGFVLLEIEKKKHKKLKKMLYVKKL